VKIFTSHCDKTHCFEEVADGTLKVTVYGDFLPTAFLGRFKIVFACLRQLVLLLAMIIFGEISEYDFFIVDQLSFCIPLLHIFHESRARILFYCHFPDQRLARHDSLLRKLYRLPFDLFEQFSMSAADHIVVNSEFTKTVYDDTFNYIKDIKIPGIIYPCVDDSKQDADAENQLIYENLIGANRFFLSINRFEIKKNIELAVDSYVEFLKTSNTKDVKLVVAGGYDHLLDENKVYLQRLEKLVEDSGLKFYSLFQKSYPTFTEGHSVIEYDVLFLPSVPSTFKDLLLSKAELLLYTPSFEHFGIVPLEAMKFGTPVLAINNGGPTETVVSLDEDPENGTGWLEPNDSSEWSKKLGEALKLNKTKISKNGIKQVESKFTRTVMTQEFEKTMLKLFKWRYQRYSWENLMMLWKLPAFLVLRKCFQLPAMFVWILGAITFLPASVFQIIAIVVTTCVYLVEPHWFTYIG
jgi:alpha-1,3/alpha-1,6-mannosyltransferase